MVSAIRFPEAAVVIESLIHPNRFLYQRGED